MGNSEVGHLNLGAGAVGEAGPAADRRGDRGRLVLRERGAARGLRHGAPSPARARVRRRRPLEHGPPEGARRARRREGVADVVVHAFTDGRDTAPDSGVRHLAEVESWGGARIATVSGRYYAMDRDKRWDRTDLAFNAIVKGEAEFSAPIRGGGGARRRTSGARRTSSSSRPWSATRAASATATARSSSTSGPTARVSSPRSSARPASRSRRSPSTTRAGTTRSRSRPRGRT